MINYVIACWSGDRRTTYEPYDKDKSFYLKKHIESLHLFTHNLDQITIVIPDNINESVEFTEFVDSIPKQIQNAKVVIIRRPNVGLSYGSYSHVYGLYRTQFSHYIFVEDDYVYVKPNFDQVMIDIMSKNPKCGFVCSLAQENGTYPYHAAIFNGLMLTEVLEILWLKYNQLPYHDSSVYGDNERAGQIGFSRMIIDEGYTLYSLDQDYFIPFFHASSCIVGFGDDKNELINIPIPMIEFPQ